MDNPDKEAIEAGEIEMFEEVVALYMLAIIDKDKAAATELASKKLRCPFCKKIVSVVDAIMRHSSCILACLHCDEIFAGQHW